MKIQQIRIEDLDFESLNIRSEDKYSHAPDIHELAYGIINFELRQPIAVCKSKNDISTTLNTSKYFILHGKRRASAYKVIANSTELNYYINGKKFKISKAIKEKFKTIPSVIFPEPKNEHERILFQIAENSNRQDINNLELSIQYNNLINSKNMKQADLAKLLNKSKQAINDVVVLKDIEPKIRKLLEEIQIYAYSLKMIETKARNKKSVIPYFSVKNIGTRTLRKIASAEKSTQAKLFWMMFGEKCTLEDAEFIGLTEGDVQEIEEDKEKDDFSLVITNYSKILKQYKKATGTDKTKLETKRATSTKELANELMKDKVFKKVVSEFILV